MTNVKFLIFLAALPVILICLYIYKKDRNKEPMKLLIKLFFLGILSCFLVLVISGVMMKVIPFFGKDVDNMNLFETILYTFIGVALVEEFCKWLFVYKIGYNNKEFDEVYDIIVYSIFVSLGFAFFENILYVLNTNSIAVGISRALLAVPGHACDAVFMGYYLSCAKMYQKSSDKNKERKNIIKSIIVPTILHGIYDFCIFAGQYIFLIIFVVFVINLYIFSIKKIKDTSKINKKIFYKNNFCPHCGEKVVGNFCSRCGTRQE